MSETLLKQFCLHLSNGRWFVIEAGSSQEIFDAIRAAESADQPFFIARRKSSGSAGIIRISPRHVVAVAEQDRSSFVLPAPYRLVEGPLP